MKALLIYSPSCTHTCKVTAKAENVATVVDGFADAATGIPTEVVDARAIMAINANIGKADPSVASEVAMASDDAKGASDVASDVGAESTAEIPGAATGNRDFAVTTVSDDVNSSQPIKDQIMAVNIESDAGIRFRMLYSHE